jgi:hypothetical protein
MVDLERLRDNLKYIRRGRGLTFAKLAECQYVMEVLGDLPLRVAYERLAGMVRMLGEDVQAVALHNAYAIDMPAPDTLTRRRDAHCRHPWAQYRHYRAVRAQHD